MLFLIGRWKWPQSKATIWECRSTSSPNSFIEFLLTNSKWGEFSDERLKDNIQTLENGLDKVEQLRGVTYTKENKKEIGVIAQEVEKILPEIVLTADDEMGTKSVDYGKITSVLIEAIKELSTRVKELENK